MGKLLRIGIAWGALLLCLPVPAYAAVASGDITEASMSFDGSHATLAGSVTWPGCEHAEEPPERPEEPPRPEEPEEGEEEPAPVDTPPPPPRYCGWTPFVTVAPGTDPAECSSPARQWPDELGPGVVLAWTGDERRDTGSVNFEVDDVPLHGGTPQLACLSVIEIAPTYREVMAECAPAFPDCNPIIFYEETPFSLPLAAALLRPEVRPEVGPELKTSVCTCPLPVRRPRPRRHARHRHRGIFVSQHRKVPKF